MSNNWFIDDIAQWVDSSKQWQPIGTVSDSEVYMTITGSKPKAMCSAAKTHIVINARDAKILMSGY